MEYNVDSLNFDGMKNLAGATGTFQHSFGINQKGLYKPFTTDVTVSGYPAYTSGNLTVETSYATQYGLNPFGINTISEGLLWGTTLNDWNSAIPDPTTVRTMGHKTPMNMVGWGFDVMGMPAPNHSPIWYASGALSPSGSVSAGDISDFLGFDGSPLAPDSGSHVNYFNYHAGPVDMRWDSHRKVWTSYNGGVWAGIVIDVQVSGGAVAYNSNAYYFAENITYDAQIYDGIAHAILVTGIPHVGPRPAPESYKIKPIAPGNFCFIVNHVINNVPRLGIYLVEPLGVEECTEGSAPVTATVDPSTVASFIFENGLLIGTGVLV